MFGRSNKTNIMKKLQYYIPIAGLFLFEDSSITPFKLGIICYNLLFLTLLICLS